MSLRSTARALPTLLQVGFAEAVAYRAEMFIWILTTTMPLIMLALWSAVAHDAPVGRFGQAEFAAYFLAAFIVRQVTGAWTAWEMNYDIRNGTISNRLLRPLHPLVAYALEIAASMPLRAAVALPVAAIGLAFVGRGELVTGGAGWSLFVVSLGAAWVLNFLISACVGCLAFFIESGAKVMELWLVLYYVFSGYLIPVELFPPGLREVTEWLPFRFQMGLPVELLTGAHEPAAALLLIGRQVGWIAVAGVGLSFLWRGGLSRYAAFGG